MFMRKPVCYAAREACITGVPQGSLHEPTICTIAIIEQVFEFFILHFLFKQFICFDGSNNLCMSMAPIYLIQPYDQ